MIALDLLGALGDVDKEQVVSFIYSLQISPGAGRGAGFIGSGFLGFSYCSHETCAKDRDNHCAYTTTVSDDTYAQGALSLLEVRRLSIDGNIPLTLLS